MAEETYLWISDDGRYMPREDVEMLSAGALPYEVVEPVMQSMWGGWVSANASFPAPRMGRRVYRRVALHGEPEPCGELLFHPEHGLLKCWRT